MATDGVSPDWVNDWILVFVDTTIAYEGEGDGIYMVDNRAPLSGKEGTSALTTDARPLDWVGFRLFVLGEQGDEAEINQIPEQLVWGFHGQPQKYKCGEDDVWIGRVEKSGIEQQYIIDIDITPYGSPKKQVRIKPFFNVHSVGVARS